MNVTYCQKCIENKESIFKVLTKEQKELLTESMNCISYKKNEIIFKEGFNPNGLISLAKGKVKIFKDGISGKEQIIRLARPGDFIGFRALFANDYYNASAGAFEDSIVCIINKDQLYKIIEENHLFALQIITFLAKELGEAENNIISLTQKHLRGRLAESLLRLSDTYGFETDNQTIKISLYREDLANLANMTTSNAIKTLYNFRDENVIELDGKKIKVLDYQALEKISRMG
ncbi:MAG: Crp/Fnr family transcriptional regulator [Bacteroidales bacterium]|nr:Crp/Fnr family transcriptional regulator [Bacteroidales bacterium]